MMKRIIVLTMAILMFCGTTASAQQGGVQLDGNALSWYTQAVKNACSENNIEVSMFTDDGEELHYLAAYCIGENSQMVTMEEILSAEISLIDAMIGYSEYDDLVTIYVFNQWIEDELKSVDAFTEGKSIKAQLVELDDCYCLKFSLEEIETILFAQDAFLRVVTDQGTIYVELNGDNIVILYLMTLLLVSGVHYADKNGDYYLNESILWEELKNQPQQVTKTAPNQSFHSDYEAIEQAAQSCFLIETYDRNDRLLKTGSGFVAFDQSTLITNEHVIDGCAYIIAYSDQYRNSYKLTELKVVDKEKDIAILKFDANKIAQPLLVDSSTRLLRGQPVTAIGSPEGILNTVSSGNISNIINYSKEIPDAIQFTAPISPGSSGGALFDDHGSVIGLCVSRHKEGDAIYYAIPIKYVEETYKTSKKLKTVTLASHNGQLITATPMPTATPKPTPKPTATPVPFKINNTVKVNKGKYTISWTGGSGAPYSITYYLASGYGKGQTLSAANISGNSYTTSKMIPGTEYYVTVRNSKGNVASGRVKVPATGSFYDGILTSNTVKIKISPRQDSDGINGAGSPVHVQTFNSATMTANIKKGWSYGLYYRIDLPYFLGERNYMETVVFRAPNGYKYIWKSSHDEYTYPGDDSWWKWDIMGQEFFQKLVDIYGKVPVGQYYVDLYWNGLLVNSKPFQIN